MKVERAKKELEEIAAILATVQEPGKEQLFDPEQRSYRGPSSGSSAYWDIKSIITISLFYNDYYAMK